MARIDEAGRLVRTKVDEIGRRVFTRLLEDGADAFAGAPPPPPAGELLGGEAGLAALTDAQGPLGALAGMLALDAPHPVDQAVTGAEAGLLLRLSPELAPFGAETGLIVLEDVTGPPPASRIVRTRGRPVTWEG